MYIYPGESLAAALAGVEPPDLPQLAPPPVGTPPPPLSRLPSNYMEPIYGQVLRTAHLGGGAR